MNNARPQRQSVRLLAISFLVLAIPQLLLFFLGQYRFAANPDLIEPNMQALYPLFRYYDPELFPHDYAGDYFMAMGIPPGFGALQWLWSRFADPLVLHRIMPLALWLACVPMVYFSAKRLGGRANAWATTAIFLGSSGFIMRMSAALPHSFVFPLLWWSIAALLAGRPVSLAVCTIASAAFYPIVTPLCGLALAFWLLMPSLTSAAQKTSALFSAHLIKKLAFLAVTAVAAALFILPLLANHGNPAYGRTIDITKDLGQYPEAYRLYVGPMTELLIMYMYQHATRFAVAGGVILTLAMLAALPAGFVLRNRRDGRPRQLRPFLYALMLLLVSSLLFSPENLYRYTTYPIAVLIALFLPLSLRYISRKLRPEKPALAFTVLALGYIFCIAKATPDASGYYINLRPYQTQALQFIRTLPKDTMTAGWPGAAWDYGEIAEHIPYVARRQTLVTYESIAGPHINYTLTMRERTHALIDAYLAQDTKALIALRDRFNVDYLVINEKDFSGPEAPKYVPPFAPYIKKRWEENTHKRFVVLKLVKTIGVYSRDGIDVLDLHRL